MLDLPAQILNILALFSPLFSKPVYKNVVLLFVGHVLTKGRRTIAEKILFKVRFENRTREKGLREPNHEGSRRLKIPKVEFVISSEPCSRVVKNIFSDS